MGLLEETLEWINYEGLLKAKEAVIKANRLASFGVRVSAITNTIAKKFRETKVSL